MDPQTGLMISVHIYQNLLTEDLKYKNSYAGLT